MNFIYHLFGSLLPFQYISLVKYKKQMGAPSKDSIPDKVTREITVRTYKELNFSTELCEQ